MMPRALAWLLFAATLTACGGSTSQTRIAGATVHTLEVDYSNVHVVQQGDAVVLIDAGYEALAGETAERVRALGLDPAAVKAIILTHGHADHAGGGARLRTDLTAQLVAGAGDQPMMAAGKNEPLCPTGSIAEGRVDEDQAATYDGYGADVWIDAPTDLAPVGGIPGRILPMPGHTRGSLVVVVGDAAFVGDLFRGAIVGGGAETHFYMCDLADNRADIRALLDAHPNVKTFFTGHFGPVDREDVEEYLADQTPTN
ncbi:MAG: MBL fold metallo-hydrolase [Myxococcales bacterium]|nr:MBL fold metallo-hydrolase [Myxococcales bacterium]